MKGAQYTAEVCAKNACAVAIVRDARGRAVLERTALTEDAALGKVLRELADYLPDARVVAA